MAQMTPAQFAETVKSDGRTVRKFLRATFPPEAHPGKGARWQLDGNKRNVAGLQKKFNAWKAEQAKLAAERAEKAAQEAAAEVEDDTTSES